MSNKFVLGALVIDRQVDNSQKTVPALTHLTTTARNASIYGYNANTVLNHIEVIQDSMYIYILL
jgi:hypothetical protein